MGATCAPKQTEASVDAEEAPGNEECNAEKITNIINDYQAENEKLKAELEEIKTQSNENVTENEVKAKQNEAVIRELEKMKALMATKDKALVRGRVKNALYAKAYSLLSQKPTTRICIKGSLKQHVTNEETKSTSDEKKWVEVLQTGGYMDNGDFTSGYVTLIHSDSKDAENTEKCEIFDVKIEDSEKEQCFPFRVSVAGSRMELVFVCEKKEQRENWIKCISDAMTEVRDEPENMVEVVTLKLEFSKEKLGIRVEESFVEETEIEDTEQVVEEVEKVETGQEVNDSANEEADVEDGKYEDEEKTVEAGCQLIVTKITDKDLVDQGLVLDYAVMAINDTPLAGMGYDEQIGLLTTTKKPFTLTFEGEKATDGQASQGNYSSILKELLADDDNSVKKAFYDLVKDTPFEKELQSSQDQVTTIADLLGNQRRLMALVHNFKAQECNL